VGRDEGGGAGAGDRGTGQWVTRRAGRPLTLTLSPSGGEGIETAPFPPEREGVFRADAAHQILAHLWLPGTRDGPPPPLSMTDAGAEQQALPGVTS
jgi:hypothetical protein